MMPPGDWEELFDGCLNGGLDEAQERELARILQESSEARRAWRCFLQIEGALLTLGKAHALGGGPAATTVERIRTLRRLTAGLIALAAAAAVLIAGARWFGVPAVEPPVPEILARVVAMEGGVDVVSSAGESRTAVVGHTLLGGDSLRTGDGNSIAVLEFADATRLELSADTTVRLADDGTRSVQLVQGLVRGKDAEKGGNPPLVVTTESLKVSLEGDRFVLSSTAPDNLRVDMQGGKAEVVRRRDQKRCTVESGAALLAEADVEEMSSGPMPRFVTEPKRILDFRSAWAVFFDPDGKRLVAASYREVQYFGPDGLIEKTALSTDKSHGRGGAFSRDGKILAVFRGLEKNDPVIVWDVGAKKQLAKVDARITDQRLVLAPDASWLATTDRDETPAAFHIWDGKTGACRFTLSTEMVVNCLASSPDSKLAAVGLDGKRGRGKDKVVVFNALTGEKFASLPVLTAHPTALAFSPDGRYLAVGLAGLVQLWDVEKRELTRSIAGFTRVLTTLAFSPDGRLLAGGTQDGQVWVWNAVDGQEIQVIQAGATGVRLLAFSPDGRSLAAGGIKGQPLMIWEVSPPPARPATPRGSAKT